MSAHFERFRHADPVVLPTNAAPARKLIRRCMHLRFRQKAIDVCFNSGHLRQFRSRKWPEPSTCGVFDAPTLRFHRCGVAQPISFRRPQSHSCASGTQTSGPAMIVTKYIRELNAARPVQTLGPFARLCGKLSANTLKVAPVLGSGVLGMENKFLEAVPGAAHRV